MSGKYRIESETDASGAYPARVSVKGPEGTRRASVVTSTESRSVREILSSGMLYIQGPGLAGKTLFRVESCRRARKSGYMFISAIEAVDPLRCRENDILREMRTILQLGSSDRMEYCSRKVC